MPYSSLITVLLLLASMCAWGGFTQGPGNDPRGRTHTGQPFKPAEKQKVANAIRSLGKNACSSCLTNMLGRGNICRETNKSSNKEGGAYARPGQFSEGRCDPKDDAINIGGLIDRSEPVLAAALVHEWCHTLQNPKATKRRNGTWPGNARPISEIPCCMREFEALKAFGKKAAKASRKAKNPADKAKADKQKKDIEKREEELCKYCCKALEDERAKGVAPKYRGDEGRLDALCKKKKKKTAGDDGGNGGDGGDGDGDSDRPKDKAGTTTTTGGSTILFADGASYTTTSEEPTLFLNALDDGKNALIRYPLRRLSNPTRPVDPYYMLLRHADELPLSNIDALIIAAFDPVDETGVIKVLGVDGGLVMSDDFEVELPGVRPRDMAYETGLPYMPTNRLYVLDSLGSRILCMTDGDLDGLPDTVHATYADAARFPVLESIRSLALSGKGDGGDLALSTDDLRTIDVVAAPARLTGLFDDDGDCVADRVGPITILPAETGG